MAGYSKKFVAEHEQEIKLHQAAKEAFSALGTQKIPKIKEIQAEYDELKEKKKQLIESGNYHGQARKEIAVTFGQLLSYSDEAIERYLAENKEKEIV